MLLTMLTILIYIVFSIPILIQDCKTCTLNPLYIYIGTFILIIISFIFQKNQIIEFTIAGFFALSIFLLIWLITNRNLGNGDIKYSFLCGFICGSIYNVIISTLISSLSGILFFLCFRVIKSYKKETKIPFTPFMFFGTILVSCISLFIG